MSNRNARTRLHTILTTDLNPCPIHYIIPDSCLSVAILHFQHCCTIHTWYPQTMQYPGLGAAVLGHICSSEMLETRVPLPVGIQMKLTVEGGEMKSGHGHHFVLWVV